MKKLFLCLLVCLNVTDSYSQQSFPLNGLAESATLFLEEVTIPSFPAFHSSAVGSYDDKWFIMGGRTNGLHGFYPPFAFPTNGRQNQIYVVDPTAGAVWSSNVDSLPQPLQEQLSSSNMQQCVIGDKMYIAGGYGYSATLDEYITFPYLTQIDLTTLSQAVIAGASPASSFKYVIDSSMAVTGGRMLDYNNRLYLFFGHKFTGRYSTTPGDIFDQEYTHQIRMFDVAFSNDSLSITNYATVTDSINFRRRDLNVTPYIRHNFANGDTVGFMAWSGVFRKDADRPYSNQIFVKPDGTYSIVEQIQKFNQYHCPSIVFNTVGETNTLFFGGMAEYEYLSSALPDTLIPFVKNVTLVKEDYFEDFYEEPSDEKLPTFYGTNAEFIPSEQYVDEENGMLILDNTFCNNIHVIGYIIGGVESTGAHISSSNDPSLSLATSKIYKVRLGLGCGSIDEYNISSIEVFPNPSQEKIQVKTDEAITSWQVMDISGKIIIQAKSNGTQSLDISGLRSGTYFAKIFTEQHLYRSTFIKL